MSDSTRAWPIGLSVRDMELNGFPRSRAHESAAKPYAQQRVLAKHHVAPDGGHSAGLKVHGLAAAGERGR